MIEIPPGPIHERLMCMGKYGMGNGYTLVDGLAYCDQGCPLKAGCWEKTKDTLRNDHPIEVEDFQVVVYNIAKRRRWSLERAGEWARVERLKFGIPDPYTKVILHNVDQGMEARKRHDPTVVNRAIGRPA